MSEDYRITQLRGWSPKEKRWIYSGRTPSMMQGFWNRVMTPPFLEDVTSDTGLKDKNGVEIYEGDIVKNLLYPSIAKVIWEQATPSTQGVVTGIFGENINLDGFIKNIGEFKFKGLNSTKAFHVGHFEVIGNIYETPELLKENKS